MHVFERDKWACQRCFDSEDTLHCHHKYYIAGNEPWDYPLEAFVTLCAGCHEEESELIKDFCSDLVLEFRKKFLATDLVNIFLGLSHMEMTLPAEVIASAYGWAFKNKNMQEIILKNYFEFIEKELENKNAGSND